MPLRVGVIGVGYLGQHHARIYAGLDDVELVGVADVDRARAEEIASLNGCRAFGDYRNLIGETEALSVVTPTTFHYEVALECLGVCPAGAIAGPRFQVFPRRGRLLTQGSGRPRTPGGRYCPLHGHSSTFAPKARAPARNPLTRDRPRPSIRSA